ncbi:MAG: TolB family protein, partial [Acidimicrobiia bacterium]
VDGTGLCQLTEGAFEDKHPHWSVRGIVFARSDRPGSGHDGLWRIQPDGSGLEALHGAAGENPTWSPDATKIAFDDSQHVYVFNLINRTVKPLTQLNAVSIIILIKPGRANTIDPKTEVRIPVAVLSAPWFDPVRQIDKSSITFGPTGTERSPASCIADDVNEDKVPDLVCQFDVADAFSSASTEGVLKAKDVKGILFEGRDAVKVLY